MPKKKPTTKTPPKEKPKQQERFKLNMDFNAALNIIANHANSKIPKHNPTKE